MTDAPIRDWLDQQLAAIDHALEGELGGIDQEAELTLPFADFEARCVARLRAARARQGVIEEALRRTVAARQAYLSDQSTAVAERFAALDPVQRAALEWGAAQAGVPVLQFLEQLIRHAVDAAVTQYIASANGEVEVVDKDTVRRVGPESAPG
jgi:hypothetical protein